MFTRVRLLELPHLFIWKPFDVIGPTSSEGYRSPPWLIFPWLSAGDFGWCHLHPLLCLGTVVEAHMCTGQHPVASCNWYSDEQISPCPSSALWRVGGAGGWQCSLPFPPPLWALHNLAFSFLWANSASDNVTVLKAWWPYTFDLLGNSDWKYCVLLSGCVRSSLEFGKAGNISRMHALRVDVLGVMSNPPAPSLQWQTLIILKFRIPLRQSNSTLSYLISRKCLQRMMKSRWWQ